MEASERVYENLLGYVDACLEHREYTAAVKKVEAWLKADQDQDQDQDQEKELAAHLRKMSLVARVRYCDGDLKGALKAMQALDSIPEKKEKKLSWEKDSQTLANESKKCVEDQFLAKELRVLLLEIEDLTLTLALALTLVLL